MKKNSRLICLSMAAGLPAMALAEEQKDYNVLFILCDQWRAQATGYAGDENAHTPNLDRFASENIVFTNAVSCQPVSSPARASLLSGQFPTTNGMIGNDLAFMPNDLTLGEVFNELYSPLQRIHVLGRSPCNVQVGRIRCLCTGGQHNSRSVSDGKPCGDGRPCKRNKDVGQKIEKAS